MRFFLLLFFIILSLKAHSSEQIKLYLKWKHQFQFAGFYMAKEKGFYKDLGLDVDIIEAKNNKDRTKLILDDINAFGISDSSLINEIMHGKELSLLAAIYQHSPFIFLSLKESGIKSAMDFKNKKVMIDLNSQNNAFINALISKYKMNKDEINFIPTSFDVQDLISKKADVMASYLTNEPYFLHENDIPYSYIYPPTLGMDFYGDILFTSKQNEINNPKRVKAFYEASIKGWHYAFNHIDETIKLIMEKYNTQNFTYDKFLYEATVLKDLSGIENGNFGKLELSRINHIISIFFISRNDFKQRDIDTLDLQHMLSDRFSDAKTSSSNLTKEEIDFLKNKKEISFCARNSFLPYIAYEYGEYKGMAIDFIEKLEEKLDIPFKAIKTGDLDECNNLVKNKKIDFVSLILTKPNVYPYLKASNPYIKGYLVLATKINEPFLLNLEDIKNKTIALSKYSKNIVNLIKTKYPFIKTREVAGWIEGLDLVRKGEVYGYLGPSDTIAYRIQERYPFELKIMTTLGKNIETGSMGIHKDNKVLLSILNKTIDSVDEKTRREIRNSWIVVKEELKIDYSLLWKLLALITVVFIAFLYRQFLLRKVNLDLEETIKKEVEKNKEKNKILFQQTKLASMGEMLNNIAHQWRQPLNSINSSVAVLDFTLMNKDMKDEKIENTLSEIESQTKYMSDTIESFRNYINPNKNKERFSLAKAINDVLSIVRYSYKKSGIEISVINRNDNFVEGYLGEYIQTIITILNNSKEALLLNEIENPKIIIYIDEMVIIDDNAGGISEEIIDRVFEPYFTTKNDNSGTGTGLYMAKMIIEHSMGGELTIENIPKGCRLKVKV